MIFDFEKLNNKSVHIAPYDETTLEFKKFLDSKINYKFLNFIDNFKKDSCVISAKELEGINSDYLIILNSSSIQEIYNTISKYYKASHILFASFENNKFVLRQKKLILCFGTCQVLHVTKILNTYLNDDNYIVSYHINYSDAFDEEYTYKNMSYADIIIYQALNEKRCYLLSDKNIRRKFKSKKLISIPYIRVDGVYSLEYNYGKILGEEYIVDLLNKGFKRDEVYKQFELGQIDFNLDNRFKTSLGVMERNYPNTDIKLSEFIKNNYKKKKLFNANLHPTNEVFYEIIRQLNILLNFNINFDKNSDFNELSEIVSTISPSDEKKYKYTLKTYSGIGWLMKGIVIIDLIITKYENSKSD